MRLMGRSLKRQVKRQIGVWPSLASESSVCANNRNCSAQDLARNRWRFQWRFVQNCPKWQDWSFPYFNSNELVGLSHLKAFGLGCRAPDSSTFRTERLNVYCLFNTMPVSYCPIYTMPEHQEKMFSVHWKNKRKEKCSSCREGYKRRHFCASLFTLQNSICWISPASFVICTVIHANSR